MCPTGVFSLLVVARLWHGCDTHSSEFSTKKWLQIDVQDSMQFVDGARTAATRVLRAVPAVRVGRGTLGPGFGALEDG